jgi:hypothetical protein
MFRGSKEKLKARGSTPSRYLVSLGVRLYLVWQSASVELEPHVAISFLNKNVRFSNTTLPQKPMSNRDTSYIQSVPP